MGKTALYIRVSTDAQYEEGYSVDAQKEKLTQYCKLKDIDNYEFFIDGGWSGSNIDRPEMQRMINEIKKGEVTAVIVYKLDRLSRSQKDTIFLLEDVFNPNGCSFISLNENFDTTTPYGKAMIGILSVFAQLERENIKERTRMGMYERVKSGLWMGGGRVPFGYDYDESLDILVPNKYAEDVKKIYELYLQGYSTNQLAEMFDVANDTHISSILDRVTYTGKILFRGELFEGKHQPIIDEETWNKVQIERKKRSVKKTVTSSFLFAGMIYCARCGSKMRYQRWGKGIKIYCYSQMKSKPKLVKDPNCDNDKLNAEEFERLVLDDLFARTEKISATKTESKDTTSVREVLEERYNSIVIKIKRLYNIYATNGDNILLQTINELKTELSSVEARIQETDNASKSMGAIERKIDTIKNLRNTWSLMTLKEKQQAVRLCIDRIIVDGNKISIQYNF